jgi:hypothetical protein
MKDVGQKYIRKDEGCDGREGGGCELIKKIEWGRKTYNDES